MRYEPLSLADTVKPGSRFIWGQGSQLLGRSYLLKIFVFQIRLYLATGNNEYISTITEYTTGNNEYMYIAHFHHNWLYLITQLLNNLSGWHQEMFLEIVFKAPCSDHAVGSNPIVIRYKKPSFT